MASAERDKASDLDMFWSFINGEKEDKDNAEETTKVEHFKAEEQVTNKQHMKKEEVIKPEETPAAKDDAQRKQTLSGSKNREGNQVISAFERFDYLDTIDISDNSDGDVRGHSLFEREEADDEEKEIYSREIYGDTTAPEPKPVPTKRSAPKYPSSHSDERVPVDKGETGTSESLSTDWKGLLLKGVTYLPAVSKTMLFGASCMTISALYMAYKALKELTKLLELH